MNEEIGLAIGIMLAKTFRSGNPPTEQDADDAIRSAHKCIKRLNTSFAAIQAAEAPQVPQDTANPGGPIRG